MSVVCCQVEVSATGWSLVQRSPTVCVVRRCVWSRNLKKEEALAHREGGGLLRQIKKSTSFKNPTCQSQEFNLLLQKSGLKGSFFLRRRTRRSVAATLADTRNSVVVVALCDTTTATCGGRSILLHQRTVPFGNNAWGFELNLNCASTLAALHVWILLVCRPIDRPVYLLW